MKNKITLSAICFCLIASLTASKADVLVSEVYAANQDESHFIGKCDSSGVKKTAHRYGYKAIKSTNKYSYRANRDNQKAITENGCFHACEVIATSASKEAAREAAICVDRCADYLESKNRQGVNW